MVRRRTRRYFRYFRYFRRRSVIFGILLVIGISVIFFLYDKDGLSTREEPVHVDQPALKVVVPDDDVDFKEIVKTYQQLDLPERKEKLSVQREMKEKPAENQNKKSAENAKSKVDAVIAEIAESKVDAEIAEIAEIADGSNTFEETNDNTLSESEIQALLSINNQEGLSAAGNINQTPKPVAGEKAFKDYIEKNRKQLSDADCEKQQGSVILMFKVNAQGRPVEITILRPLCRAADLEAVRLLQNGPNWTTGDSFARLEITF